jgi:ssDNA thymidine ADP-ribosyltransferase DarT-like protein
MEDLDMSNNFPMNPKIYHIVHIDRLTSIIDQGCLWSDAEIQNKNLGGTMIGMSHIKKRRMKNHLHIHSGLTVGQCVPFYFCPRSIMLYIISQQSHKDISCRGGEKPIIHLQADLNTVVDWAQQNNKRWAFTDSNAGSSYFNSYCSLSDLNKIDWYAVDAHSWSQYKEKKQAEFLLEEQFPWSLVEAIGVYSQKQFQQVGVALKATSDQPTVSIQRNWYY